MYPVFLSRALIAGLLTLTVLLRIIDREGAMELLAPVIATLKKLAARTLEPTPLKECCFAQFSKAGLQQTICLMNGLMSEAWIKRPSRN